MKLTLGFSPCPNDTFIFDALVNGKIDTEGLDFDVHLEDVQTLNEWALEGRLDISKISYGVLPKVLDKYRLLQSGGALGSGVGPLLITNKQYAVPENELATTMVNDAIIAIPGENTTAHFLFSLAYPNATHKLFMRFDEIEDFILHPPSAVAETGSDVMGVIIHENRFTYKEKGLHKVTDLGEYWEKKTGKPIPLGGIIMRKNSSVAAAMDHLIRRSIEYAWSKYPELSAYTKKHSQEMSEAVMRKHITLYVNGYSTGLGADGREAVKKIIEIYSSVHDITSLDSPFFFD